MADFSLLTLAQLQAEFVRLGGLLATMQDTRHALHQLIMTRMAEAKARERILTMSDADKDALRAVLNADATIVRTL